MPRAKNVASSEDSALYALATTLTQRMLLASQVLGSSYDGTRKLYTALGYKTELSFDDYYARYSRQDIANRVVSLPASASWRKEPVLTEGDGENESELEKAFKLLCRTSNVLSFLSRTDRLAGIGQYAVLLLGFDDGPDMSQEVTKANRLVFLRPYMECNATIQGWEEDPKNERYGMPKSYNLTITSANNTSGRNSTERNVTLNNVHHSRVLHIADGLEEDMVFGTPRLKAVFNRLQDLELVSGSSAEMFWRGAFPGYAFKHSPGPDNPMPGEPELAKLQEAIEEYMHGLKRYIKTVGMDVQSLEMQVASPEGHSKLLVSLISAGTGIPQRLLLGSERGELSSSQDDENWQNVMDERRHSFNEPMLLRPLVDRLIKVGALPQPKSEEDGYSFEWPDLYTPGEKEQAETAKTKTEALSAYASGGASTVVPPEIYLTKFLGFTKEEVDDMQTMVEEDIVEEEESELERRRAEMEIDDEFAKRRESRMPKPKATPATSGGAVRGGR